MKVPDFLAGALKVASLVLPVAVALPVAAQGVFVSPPPSASASAQMDGKRAHVAGELRLLGYPDADVRTLSNGQIARIEVIIHSDRSPGTVKGLVGSVLRGGGILQRVVDGLERR